MPAERRRLILEMLREHGNVTVEEVQKRFGVSSMTGRRDLALLSQSGHLRRTHGGAVVPDLWAGKPPFLTGLEQDVSGKQRLAEAVTRVLKPRETVFLDSSSASYYVARQMLETALPMTVITNSLAVIHQVGDAQPIHLELIGLGGAFRRPTQSFVDAQTIRTIEGDDGASGIRCPVRRRRRAERWSLVSVRLPAPSG